MNSRALSDLGSDPSITEAKLFKDAMASFPSGVTIVTTVDDRGEWWGFTASSFCSVSMDPPLVLSCLAKTAQCHTAFEKASRWNVHIIHDQQQDIAGRFATRGADKFAGGTFQADRHGIPVLPDASVLLRCVAHAKSDGGDHTILIGRVEDTQLSPRVPTVYFRRAFHGFSDTFA
ncbi:flavin reductase family protein [Rhodococcus koreensis]|uniref:flavin reductase family protein n=1 Tax=Rhodococcus koreensis TaxID=99653 RepID=UPI00366A95AD